MKASIDGKRVRAVRWQRIQELFHQAADLAQDEWRPFLEKNCDDESIVADVLLMLEEDARGTSLLDRGVAHAADRMVGDVAFAVPADLGPYRITGVLGEGGMGVVYRAERADVGSVVAVKILRDAWLSPARRDRFAREQRLLAQLNHPCIARLHDAGVLADGIPWFVMEFVDGLPLAQHCREHDLPIDERVRLLRQVCEAVEHAHRNLVIHRDLKPSNILVTRDGKVKLLDFGISKQLDSSQRRNEETGTVLRLLTPAYAAPEQIRGQSTGIDTDIYSLGVVLYELLAGRLPFDLSNCTPAEAETILLERLPDKPSVLARRLAADGDANAKRAALVGRAAWADLDVLSLTAMHKDRERRYRTVGALIRDVDHYLAGEPLEARPDDLGYRVGKFVRRHWRPLAIAALTVATVAVLVVFYTVRLASARNRAVAQASRAERIQRFMLNLFEGADKEAGPTSKGLSAVTLVDRGAKEANSLAAEPAVRAELFETLGTIYEKLGDLPRAEGFLQEALDQRRTLFGEESAEVGKSLVGLGNLRLDQAHFAEAERFVREGLAKDKRLLPPNDPAVARATTALGKVLLGRGAYDDAINVLDEAVRLSDVPGRKDDLAAAVTELANSHFYAGHYDACRTLTEQGLGLHRELYGTRHPTVSSDLINLGAIQFELANYTEAERLYRQGVEITKEWYGAGHPQIAADVIMLARALNRQDKSDEASDLLKGTLDSLEATYGKIHPTIGSLSNELGSIALGKKDYDEARVQFRRMLDTYRAVYGDKGHYYIGIALSNLGTVSFYEKDYKVAERHIREAVALLTEKLGPTHLTTMITRQKLGHLLLVEERYAEAEVETLASYEAMKPSVVASSDWLKRARQDLVAEYDGLGRADRAKVFRDELAAGPE